VFDFSRFLQEVKMSLQQKFKEIVALASLAERYMIDPPSFSNSSPGDKAIKKLLDAVRDLQPEVRELLEMDL
jgi:hypothetical protein